MFNLYSRKKGPKDRKRGAWRKTENPINKSHLCSTKVEQKQPINEIPIEKKKFSPVIYIEREGEKGRKKRFRFAFACVCVLFSHP